MGGDKILKGTTFTKYKQFVENCFAVLPRQALHAKTLGFETPPLLTSILALIVNFLMICNNV